MLFDLQYIILANFARLFSHRFPLEKCSFFRLRFFLAPLFAIQQSALSIVPSNFRIQHSSTCQRQFHIEFSPVALFRLEPNELFLPLFLISILGSLRRPTMPFSHSSATFFSCVRFGKLQMQTAQMFRSIAAYVNRAQTKTITVFFHRRRSPASPSPLLLSAASPRLPLPRLPLFYGSAESS